MNKYTCDIANIEKSASLRGYLVRNNVYHIISKSGIYYHYEISTTEEQARMINAFINSSYTE